ncbi:hypothetical protein [Flectobacillus longus]|uniref:hypothetical protein n=1 Tax=Flectobacillus longus TaxID=2984207 RepID=UPI0024B80407|nr:hypothetical protein [Flectobacillus longus]MDI9882744.1 hypothetical protein [Flectobacillus longus]
MKIVSIVEGKLHSFFYSTEEYNEFDRLMDLWTDVSYLYDYAENNQVQDISAFVNDIQKYAEQIQDLLLDLEENNDSLNLYFEPLQNSEYAKILSLQKGKIRGNQLRLYAIKIDDECFVITGGAIKMSPKMQDHPDTANELLKLNTAKSYLHQNDVIDESSFYELISESI